MENKTYYDWLEISPKASPEVIEKAYKALVIKYHPDLNHEGQSKSEEIIKKINEAYSVLSNAEKKAEYDATLINTTVSKDDYDKLQKELNYMKKQQNQQQAYNNQYNYNQEINNLQQQADYQAQVQAAKQKAYRDAYIQDLQSRGYKIHYKKSFKYYVKLVAIILIILFVIWLAWQITFIRNWINSIAENNFLIKLFVDIVKSIYEALFETFF